MLFLIINVWHKPISLLRGKEKPRKQINESGLKKIIPVGVMRPKGIKNVLMLFKKP